MSELRIAVVGVGRMGQTHAENLVHRTRGARLVAVTTSSAERAEAVRRCCGAVPVYDDLDLLIESESLDAVIVSSSTSAHVENVEQCAASKNAQRPVSIFSVKSHSASVSRTVTAPWRR